MILKPHSFLIKRNEPNWKIEGKNQINVIRKFGMKHNRKIGIKYNEKSIMIRMKRKNLFSTKSKLNIFYCLEFLKSPAIYRLWLTKYGNTITWKAILKEYCKQYGILTQYHSQKDKIKSYKDQSNRVFLSSNYTPICNQRHQCYAYQFQISPKSKFKA